MHRPLMATPPLVSSVKWQHPHMAVWTPPPPNSELPTPRFILDNEALRRRRCQCQHPPSHCRHQQRHLDDVCGHCNSCTLRLVLRLSLP